MLPVPTDSTDERMHRGQLARAIAALQRFFDGVNFRISGAVKANSFNSSAGVTALVASGTPVTIGGVGSVGMCIVNAYLRNSADPANYTAYAVVISEGSGAARLGTVVNGGLLTITLSGANIQATQGSGPAASINYTITYFG